MDSTHEPTTTSELARELLVTAMTIQLLKKERLVNPLAQFVYELVFRFLFILHLS